MENKDFKWYVVKTISGKEEKTPNDKIFKSKESFPSDDILSDALYELELSVKDNNTKIIRAILERHVEGFNEQQ